MASTRVSVNRKSCEVFCAVPAIGAARAAVATMAARLSRAARERFTADGLLRTQTNDHCALARIRAFASMSPIVKVCGCRPHEGGAAHTGGRRTQTSKGGNRVRCGEVARQTLWRFRRPQSVETVVLESIERAANLVG